MGFLNICLVVYQRDTDYYHKGIWAYESSIEINMFCASTAAEARAKIWYQ